MLLLPKQLQSNGHAQHSQRLCRVGCGRKAIVIASMGYHRRGQLFYYKKFLNRIIIGRVQHRQSLCPRGLRFPQETKGWSMGVAPKGKQIKKRAARLFFHFNLYIIMSPIQGYIDFGNFIDIALTDYAIQYRPYGATRLQTNNPNGVIISPYEERKWEQKPQRGDITQHSP